MKRVAFALVLFLASASAAAGPAKKLTAAELERAAREAIATSLPKLPKDAKIKAVKAASATELAFAPSRVTIEVTPPPRRAGTVMTTATLSFWKDAITVGTRAPITIELDVPQSSLAFDVTKGAGVTLAIERGLVVVSTPAVAGSDADIGDVIQVLLRPSGRAVRARVVAKDRAVATEDVK